MNDKSVHMSMIAFMDNDAINTNDKYLYEFCKIALYQEGYEGLHLTHLRERILSFIPLDYTEEEISHCIKRMGSKEVILEKEKYFLTSEAESEMQGREKSFALRKYIDNYCDCFMHEKQSIDRNSLCDLVSRFLFEKFRESLERIYCILDPIKKTALQYSNEYLDDEKEFINSFLAWDNEEKNQAIYKLIIKSYDFCAINCPAEISFDFSEFDFYLDANIVMRLMGINNARRKDVVERFIDKCKHVKIKLHVSAFSKVEIQHSIDRQINEIQNFINETGRIIAPELVDFAPTDRFSRDMYKKFYDYMRQEKTKNLNEFKQHMYQELERCLEKFCFEDAISYELEDSEKFNKYVTALSKIKDEKVVKTDANNILLVLDKRESNKDTYLISADGRLINWCKEIFAGQTSLIEFPSVWLALIMKYTGRATQDDYSAFCKFIRLPIVTKDKDIKKKAELKVLIDKMDASDYMKDKMLEELKNNFEHYSELETSNEIQQEAYQRVMKAHDESILKGEEEKYSAEIFRLKEESAAEKEVLEKQLDEMSQMYQKEKELQESTSVTSRINKRIQEKVKKKKKNAEWLKCHKARIYVITFVVIVVAMIFLSFWIKNFISKWLGLYLTIASFVMEIVVAVITNALIESWGNEYEQRARYEKKYKKKYKEIIE